jgi:galactokinase
VSSRRPTVTWAAPGRVNLIGEHTDYNDGFVLPIALSHRTVATVALRDDRELRFRSEAGDVGKEYAEGVLAAFRSEGYDVPGADIEVTSDVPIGAGLSSSAALECAIAGAVDELNGLGLTRPQLVRIAQRAENDYVGVPTGILDQSASMLCEAGHALFMDCRDGSTQQVPFDPSAVGLSLVVIDTRAHHSLADGQYARRREECVRACEALGVASLRDARTVEDIEDPVLRARARHIVTENLRVVFVADLLTTDDESIWRLIGTTMTESHASLRDDYEVSAPELDVAVQAALEAGARGARMTGGGFGGSAIALTADVPAVTTAVEAAFAAHGFTAPRVFVVEPGDGARRVDDAG